MIFCRVAVRHFIEQVFMIVIIILGHDYHYDCFSSSNIYRSFRCVHSAGDEISNWGTREEHRAFITFHLQHPHQQPQRERHHHPHKQPQCERHHHPHHEDNLER